MAQANRSFEIGTGLFVLLGFAALGFLTTQLPGSGLQLGGGGGSYAVTAQFDDIGGLKVGAPVTMAGVNIGRVNAIAIDPSDYRAKVTLGIQSRYAQIPDDSNAAIQTAGLLGANYIGITAGASPTFLHAGSQIVFTQSALVLENLINKFFANSAGNSNSGGNGNAASAGKSGGGSNPAGHSGAPGPGGTSGGASGGASGAPKGGATGAPTGGATGAPKGGATGAPAGGATGAPKGGATGAPAGGTKAGSDAGPADHPNK